MLGIARAGQMAGWGDVPAKFKSEVKVISQIYGSNTGYLSAYIAPINLPDTTSTNTFNTTGLTNTYGSAYAVTFKVSTSATYTWANTDFLSGYQNPVINSAEIQLASLSAGNSNVGWDYLIPKPIKHAATGNIGCVVGYSTYTDIRFNKTWDSLADRWMTLVVSVGSSGDFAGFVHDTATYGAASGTKQCRAYLYDSKTGELIAKTDKAINPFNYYITDRTSQTWMYGYENGTSNFQVAGSILSYDTSIGYVDTGFKVSAFWGAYGQPFDPAVVGLDPVGNVFAETIGSMRAWVNFTIASKTNSQVYGLLSGRAQVTSPNTTLLGTMDTNQSLSTDTP